MNGSSMTRSDIQKELDSSPFISFMQMTCTEMDTNAGTMTITMPMRPELERGAGTGQFHGGAIASLIDTVGDFAVVMVTGGIVPTINFRVDYLRPAFGKYLTGKALIRRVGRTIGVIDVDIYDESGKLTAVGRGCYGTSNS